MLHKKLSVKDKIQLVSSRSGMLPSSIFRVQGVGSQSTHQLTMIGDTATTATAIENPGILVKQASAAG